MRLEGVKGDTLSLSGVDLVDGTPVLDVKPYIPSYDAPRPETGPVRTAAWVDPPSLETITFSAEAEEDLLALRGTGPHAGLTADEAQFRRALEQTLAADPRPLYRWRREQSETTSADNTITGGGASTRTGRGTGGGAGGEYDVKLDGIICRCRFERDDTSGDERVVVLSLALGTKDEEGK